MQEKLEQFSLTAERGSKLNKVSRVASVIAISLGATSFASSVSANTLKDTNVRAADYLTPTLKGGLCYGGACTMNILDTPYFKNTSQVIDINLPNNHILTHWYWPRRAYGGQPGNPVAIDCFINNGARISTNWNGKPLSSYWYEIIVPLRHVESGKMRQIIEEPNSPIKTVSFSGQKAVLGWASVESFGNEDTIPVKKVPECPPEF